MRISRNTIKLVSLLWISAMGGSFLNFMAQLVLARNLSKEDFGFFMSWLTIMNFLVPLVGFGIPQFWLKIYGEEGLNAKRWINKSFQYITISIITLSITLFIYSITSRLDFNHNIYLICFFFYAIGQVFFELISSILQIERNYTKISIIQFSQHFLRLFLIFISFYILNGANLLYPSLSYFLVAILMIYFFKEKLIEFKKNGVTEAIKLEYNFNNLISTKKINNVTEVIRNSWPYGLGTLSYIIYYQGGIVYLNLTSGGTSSAIYIAALNIITAIYLFPAALYQKFLLPKIHVWINRDKEKLIYIYQKSNVYMGCIGLVASIIIYLLSEKIILILYGPNYVESASILRIFSISIPFTFMSFNAGAMLASGSLMRKKVKIMSFVAIISIVGFFLIKESITVEKVAMISILSNLLLYFFYWFNVKENILKTNLE